MNLTFAKAVDRYVGMALCAGLALGRQVREMVSSSDRMVSPDTILLVKFWGLGNIVLLLPVLRLLRRRFPDSRIVFVSLARNRELLDACADVDERVYVDDRNGLKLMTTLIAAAVRARRVHPDVCIDFEQFARASVVLASLAGAKQLIGLDTPGQGRARLVHKLVRYDDKQHMGQTYLDLARAAGVDERLYRPTRPPVGDLDRAEAREVLGPLATAAGPLLVIHPGSGDNFQGRRWPTANFAALADRLIETLGARIVVTGTRGEAALTSAVVSAMAHGERAVDAAGRLTVLGLTGLLEGATGLVTNDTAPVHLGSALGIPVFAFFGPNTPRLYGPLSAGSYTFYRALPCSPCLTNMNYKTSLCRMPVCIRDITVDEVHARIVQHLGDGVPAA